MKVKAAQWKKNLVDELAKKLVDSPIVGVLNMENLPTAQLQKMKKQMMGKAEIFMTKKRLIKLAIEKAKTKKAGIEKITQELVGMPALMFTKENPFALYKMIKKSKSRAPAKPGQAAPADITIPAGPTPFAPGPVISELGALGLKTKVESGKITISFDKVVVKEGEKISGPLSSMLMKLGIEPMEIGLDLRCVFEGGLIYGKSVLDIDEKKFMADLSQAAKWALNLSVETGFITKDNINVMIAKAYRDAKAIAISQAIMEKEVVGDILARAKAQAQSVASTANVQVN